jgi:hypothetical protein
VPEAAPRRPGQPRSRQAAPGGARPRGLALVEAVRLDAYISHVRRP